MLEVSDQVIVILEGSPKIIRSLTDRWRAIYGAIASVIVSGVTVAPSGGVEETAQLIYSIASKSQSSWSFKRHIIARKPRLSSIREWQEYIVQCLPNVGPKIARKLLARYGSVRAVFNASSTELSRVEGLSEAEAQEIITILNARYTTGESSRSPDEGVRVQRSSRYSEKTIEDYIRRESG